MGAIMPTQSEAIRSVLAKQPDATPTTILATLKRMRGLDNAKAALAAYARLADAK